MVARWLQQKIAKQKRGRRAWAKPFSMRNTGPMKDPTYTNEKGEPVSFGIGARTKVARSTFDEHLLKKFRFNPNSVESIYARTRGLHTDLAGARKPQRVDQEILLAKLVQSKLNAGSVQGERRYVYKIMRKTETRETRLFISGEDCFFVEEVFTPKEVIYKMSVEYIGVHRARDDFERDRIMWDTVERKPLPKG